MRVSCLKRGWHVLNADELTFMTPWNNSTHFHSKHFMCVVLSILIDKWSCSQLSMHMFQVKERVFRLLRRLNKSNFLEKWAYGMSLIIMSKLNSSVFTTSFVFELNLVLLMWTVFLYYFNNTGIKKTWKPASLYCIHNASNWFPCSIDEIRITRCFKSSVARKYKNRKTGASK